ncbi:hypothetical protein TWF481_012227 [Arthrobotrys musiformis]|uniref:F-box domain-containing protein n=1 Tax=Arthrobotrys musiformis TaxID=47236 RepID=A0AAV9VWE1_9PEZI
MSTSTSNEAATADAVVVQTESEVTIPITVHHEAIQTSREDEAAPGALLVSIDDVPSSSSSSSSSPPYSSASDGIPSTIDTADSFIADVEPVNDDMDGIQTVVVETPTPDTIDTASTIERTESIDREPTLTVDEVPPPVDGPSSSSVEVVLENDTPTSSEPSTPTMTEITVLGGEGVVPVPEGVLIPAPEEGVLPAPEEGGLPAPEGGNVEENVEGGLPAAEENVVGDVPVAVPEEAPAAGEAVDAVAGEGTDAAAGEGVDAAAAPQGEDNAAAPNENDPVVPVENEAPPEQAAETTTEAAPEETPAAPAEPEEPPWVYDPTKPTPLLSIPPEIILHTINFLPLYNMKEFSLCSKVCRSLAVRRIFKHVNISSGALEAFQKDGPLHEIADAVFGIVIRTRYLGTATEVCKFMRECMYPPTATSEGLDVFKSVRRIKLSYGQIRYDRASPTVPTGPLDSLTLLDTNFVKAMFLCFRKMGFWKKIRWFDFVVKFWEDRHGLFDEAPDESVKPENRPGYLSEEDGKYLEEMLEDNWDGDMASIAPKLKEVRLINFKPRRRVVYRRKIDIFEVLSYIGGKPEKVVLEYISAGESIDLIPASRIDQARVQRGVEELWVNMASFDVPGFMDEIETRFVDLKSLLLIVTTAGGDAYSVPAKGVAGDWRRGVLRQIEKIKGLKTFMLPVRMGQEGENINHGRRKELGEVPKDIVERLTDLVIYWIENGADTLEKVIFERKELEDEVDSAVGPGWVCKVRWENKRPKLEWTVENVSVSASI